MLERRVLVIELVEETARVKAYPYSLTEQTTMVLLHESSKGLHEQPLLVILKLQPAYLRIFGTSCMNLGTP